MAGGGPRDTKLLEDASQMKLRQGSVHATSSFVCFKEVIRKAALAEKMLTVEHKKTFSFKVAKPSIDKLEVPKTLATSMAKLQVCEGSVHNGKQDEKMNKPGHLGRAADVRSSVRNPPPEHKPLHPHQATGARPKTGRLLRRSTSMTSDRWRLVDVSESQKEKTKMHPREERVAQLPKIDKFNKDSKHLRTVNRALSPPCLYCKGIHAFKECPQFAKHPHDLKLEVIRKAGLCFGCLGEGHFSKSCNSRLLCPICFRDHPRILHIQSLDEWIKELFKDNKELTVGKLWNIKRTSDSL